MKAENKKLTPRQELFCEYFAVDKECRGNGLKAYAKAYDIDIANKSGVNTAKSNAYRLLTNAYIKKTIGRVLEGVGLNEIVADCALLDCILQNEDLSVKIWAIREFNVLRGRCGRT